MVDVCNIVRDHFLVSTFTRKISYFAFSIYNTVLYTLRRLLPIIVL